MKKHERMQPILEVLLLLELESKELEATRSLNF